MIETAIRWWGLFKKRVGTPGYGTAIAFLGLFAGFYGALYPDEIKSAFPIVLFPVRPWHFVPEACIFWVCVLIWFVLFWTRQIVEGEHLQALKTQGEQLSVNVAGLSQATGLIDQNVRKTLTGAKKLDESIGIAQVKIKELNDSIQTLPPPTYLRQLEAFTLSFNGYLGSNLSRQPATNIKSCDSSDDVPVELKIENLEGLTRQLLWALATLAQTYDEDGWRYAANVMYFVAYNDPQFADVSGCEELLPRGCTVSDIDGALVLDPKLTASADSNKIDDKVLPIHFPILKPHKTENGKWRVLPGAALAFAESRYGRDPDVLTYALVDLQKINTTMAADYDFEEKVINTLRDRFDPKSPGKWVRSGLSFPLFEMCQSNGETRERAFAVLNVHCNREKMLGPSQERQRLFAVTALHLVNETAEVVRLWLALRKRGNRPPDEPIKAG